MLRDDFIASDEWQAILRVLDEWEANCITFMRGSENFPTSRYFSGQLDVIDSVRALPEKILTNGEPLKKDIPEDVIDLPNHPRPTRTLF